MPSRVNPPERRNMSSTSSHRTRLIGAAAICLLTAAFLAFLVHDGGSSLQAIDHDVGAPMEAWSFRHAAAVKVLLAIELIFGTISTIVYVVVLVLGLAVAGHRRAIVWTVAVMVGTSATTTVMKLAFRRERPQWDDSVHTLTSFSFPSGHASGIASGMGVVVVLSWLYIQRKAIRWSVLTAAVTLVAVVGADRILLGVHNLSDVLAGYMVAGFWIFAMLAAYPPETSGHVASAACSNHPVADDH
ncbi:MAG: dagK 2 [Nocardioides sp.]|jgi:membrane-associated phospholipid phosphatase|nr:dagK 2 [Nocardioides sp.]